MPGVAVKSSVKPWAGRGWAPRAGADKRAALAAPPRGQRQGLPVTQVCTQGPPCAAQRAVRRALCLKPRVRTQTRAARQNWRRCALRRRVLPVGRVGACLGRRLRPPPMVACWCVGWVGFVRGWGGLGASWGDDASHAGGGSQDSRGTPAHKLSEFHSSPLVNCGERVQSPRAPRAARAKIAACDHWYHNGWDRHVLFTTYLCMIGNILKTL